MNRVLLTGRVATEPRYIETKSSHLCIFRIAVRKPIKTAGDLNAEFISVATWGNTADACHNHLEIGREVSITGRLQTRSYVKDDETHWSTEVVADQVEFMGPKRSKIDKVVLGAVPEQTRVGDSELAAVAM